MWVVQGIGVVETSSVKIFVVTVQTFVSKFLFTVVFFRKGKKSFMKPFTL